MSDSNDSTLRDMEAAAQAEAAGQAGAAQEAAAAEAAHQAAIDNAQAATFDPPPAPSE